MKFLLGDDACFMVEKMESGASLEKLKSQFPQSIWLGFDHIYEENIFQAMGRNDQEKNRLTYENYLKYKKTNKSQNVLVLKVFNASSNIKKFIIFKAILGRHQVFRFGRTPDNEVNVNISDISRKHLR
jgi:hypothetical protein